ncbi:hypothetical protein [Mycoplasma sp. CSL7503-lung]|uniref:hypothetical protein n=1 Tax=Mycoplasma sp. CSL7503-lung TaxID=536372 RepID=UPI0021D296B9|nr:hypothetical protein [Mycoplasma sp. CSL7503-lung]MCU4706947.1 hypothetical protein [Mycoplasma sp. CSL7503-lung]
MAYILFALFGILLVFLIIVTIFFIKSIYIERSSKRNQKITNEISRSVYENETNLTRLKLLSKNNNTYEKMYSELNVYYNTLIKYSSILKDNLENSNNYIRDRKTKELFKVNIVLKKNLKKFKINELKAKNITIDFQKTYENIDESVSRIIQVCEYLMKRLESFVNLNFQTVNYIFKEVLKLKRETKAILDKKTNSNINDLFIIASEKEKHLFELFKLENNHLAIEYMLFGPLLNFIKSQNVFSNEQSKVIEKHLKEIKNTWLDNNFNTKLLIDKIRSLYFYLSNVFVEFKFKSIIDDFKKKNNESIINYIFNLIETKKDEISKLNLESRKRMKDELSFYYEKLKIFTKETDNNNYLSSLEDLVSSFKELERNVYLILLENTKNSTCDIKNELSNIENLYYIVIQHKFLPKNNNTLMITDSLENLYKNIQKKTDKNNLTEWITNIEKLIIFIGENIEYKQMYEKLIEYVIDNKKYNDKIQVLKSFLLSAENNIKNSDYKAAYKIMKKFILTQ